MYIGHIMPFVHVGPERWSLISAYVALKYAGEVHWIVFTEPVCQDSPPFGDVTRNGPTPPVDPPLELTLKYASLVSQTLLSAEQTLILY
jgi:hypothetical protein